MNARWIVLPLALAGLAVALRAAAIDAPHDKSFTVGDDCTTCHALHNATGAGLINQPTNFTLCANCHNPSATGGRLGYPWGTGDQATPGSGGEHHHWDSLANNATYGAVAPDANSADPDTRQMGIRVKNGYLQCSTCHNQHSNTLGPQGTQHTNIPVGSAQNNVSGSGNCQLTLNQPAADAAARGYLVQLTTDGNVGTAKFKFSNDGGLSWFVEGGAACADAACSNATVTGANKQLNDTTKVTVTFTQPPPVTACSGTALTGGPDNWKFYVSYPFLRVTNVNSSMCEKCHTARVQSAAYVEGGGDGVKVFSHPSGPGVTLGRSYDRASTALLDANGALQTTGDGNPTNDLRLGTDNTVRCMTCHYPHNADSNSLTVDVR